ncbi:MAG: hypothetical protein M0R22_04415 [Dehalococcoidia bacterium]|nr:hypothetical protein [Dehalococcoidia bacterium]
MSKIEATKLNARFLSATTQTVEANLDKMTRAQRRRYERVAKLDTRRKNRVWASWQERAADAYEQETGKKVGTFGDGQFLQWLIDNFDKWFPILLKILALFGL